MVIKPEGIETEYLLETRRRMAVADGPRPTLHGLFADIDDSYLMWLLTEGREALPELAKILPDLPTIDEQTAFTGRHGPLAFEQAVAAYRVFKDIAASLGLDLVGGSYRAIDFGCGWGRITQVMLRDISPENLIGLDVWDKAVEICRRTRLPCEVREIEPWPPVDISSDSIDLIVAYSVFSHLSEENHWAWMKEFHRILKPGGVVAVTSRPRSFIEYVATLRSQSNVPSFAGGASVVFQNTDEALGRYDSGEYCFDNAGRGGGPLVEFYGETCIPEEYIERKWRGLYSDTRFIDVNEHKAFDQNALAAKK